MSAVHRRFAALLLCGETLVLAGLSSLLSRFGRTMCEFNQADGRDLDRDCDTAGLGAGFYGLVVVVGLVLLWSAVLLASARLAERLPKQVTAASLLAVALLQLAATTYAVPALLTGGVRPSSIGTVIGVLTLVAIGYVGAVAVRRALTVYRPAAVAD
ncbi:hypothetical protein ACWDR3_45370 [Streptomyces sp. NPDC001002]